MLEKKSEEIRKRCVEREKEIDEAIISICRWIKENTGGGGPECCELPEIINALANLIEAQDSKNIGYRANI